ncbi:MAG: PAS domain-containing protein [Natronincolaceae bacterium]|jgi:PAS domain S-box-containing protein|nr:PAS domain-containing protein [Bacillota bacterium]NLK90091.1 PAS domain-containing protein [Clostridiales bacterium]
MEICDNGIELMTDFFNAYKDAILILDGKFIIRYVNREASSLFSILKGELIGGNFWAVLSNIIQLSNTEGYKVSESGECKTVEVYHRGADKWFGMSIGVLNDFGYYVTLTDITEKVGLMKKLNQGNKMYRAFMETCFDNIYEVNSEWDRISVIRENAIPGSLYVVNPTNIKQPVYPEDRPIVEARINKAISNKEPYDSKHRIMGKDGKYIWVRSRAVPIMDDNGDVMKWIGATSDITLEKEFELRSIEKEKEYLELLDSSAVGFYIVDCEKEEFFVSNEWKKNLGLEHLSSKEMYLNQYGNVHPEDVEKLKISVQETISKREDKFVFDYRVKTRDKECLWVLTQAKFIYNTEGELIKIFGTHKDITDRKLAEIALKKSERKANELVAELKKADEHKNNFISTLAHELRNPLATISMGLSLLEQTIPGSEADVNARRIIERQTAQLTRLVGDILSTGRILANKMKLKKRHIEINGIIKELIDEYKALFDKEKIEIMRETHIGPTCIHADPMRIKQAMGNLLSNALKFTEKGGKVKIIVSKDKDTENILIEVIDSGIGISPELLPGLFGTFVQLDNSLTRNTSGLGLGLAIVKGIIELHNGSIEARSEGIGKGTQFILKLPISDTVL